MISKEINILVNLKRAVDEAEMLLTGLMDEGEELDHVLDCAGEEFCILCTVSKFKQFLGEETEQGGKHEHR